MTESFWEMSLSCRLHDHEENHIGDLSLQAPTIYYMLLEASWDNEMITLFQSLVDEKRSKLEEEKND